MQIKKIFFGIPKLFSIKSERTKREIFNKSATIKAASSNKNKSHFC